MKTSVPPSALRKISKQLGAKARYQDDPHLAGVGTYFPEAGEPEWTVTANLNGLVRPIRVGEIGKIKRATADHVSKQLTAHGVGKFSDDLTVRAVATQFLEDRRPTWKENTYRSNCHSVNRFGTLLDLNVADVDRQMVAIWYQHTRCARTLSILSSLLNYARENALIPAKHNPCRGLRRKEKQFKAHFLTHDEYRRVGETLQRALTVRTAPAAAVLLLALTGARKSEILDLRWHQVSDKGLQLQDSKSGPRFIVLGPQARWILGRLPLGAPDHFVIRHEEGHRVSGYALRNFWQTIRKKSGLPGRVRLHDLRHGFASAGINTGEDISVISRLLGHLDPASTLTYSHLSPRAVRADCERAFLRLYKQLAGEKTGSIAP
jgi:integrase